MHTYKEYFPSLPAHVRQAQQYLAAFLREQGSDAPQLVAERVLMHVLQLEKIPYIHAHAEALSPIHWKEACAFAMRHAEGEPLAYLLGYKEFYGRNFLVTRHTLIPRPESEDVLDGVLHAVQDNVKNGVMHQNQKIIFADVGTGSGCLACTFAKQVPQATGFMVDISQEALKVARKNAQNLGLANKIQALQADLCTMPFGKHALHVLISNPPYVSEEEFCGLAVTVRDFEPKSALVPRLPENEKGTSDPHGLWHLETLARQAYDMLKEHGLCVVEHGFTQGKAVRELFAKHGSWKSVETGKDLSGLDRYCLCRK